LLTAGPFTYLAGPTDMDDRQLAALETQVIDSPNLEGDLNFNEKLEQQLVGAATNLYGG